MFLKSSNSPQLYVEENDIINKRNKIFKIENEVIKWFDSTVPEK